MKKLRFFNIIIAKKKLILTIFVCLLFIFGGIFIYYEAVEKSVAAYNGYTIVLDANHGGVDVK